MAQTRDIVVLGGSTAGLGAAHGFLKHTYPSLKSSGGELKFVLHLVEPSSHYWWKICAPRASVSVPDFPHEKTFVPMTDAFKQYDQDAFIFHQASATSVDTDSRTVTIQSTVSKEVETLSYYALIIATGASTPTPLTSIHGSHERSIAALDDMNKRLASATSVIIGGGGPVAVEMAGEIGEHLNGIAGWFKARPESPKAKITLITSSDQLLPVLPKSYTAKAEKFLNRVGVDVIYNTRIDKTDLSRADGAMLQIEHSDTDKSTVHLSNGQTMTADVYIPAIGTTPNTAFLPKALLDERGRVKCDKTLRVEGAGGRVYVVGDAGAYTDGGVMSIYSAVPVVTANLSNDIASDGGKAGTKGIKDKEYTFKLKQTQLVPIGKSKGVAAFSGTNMPSVAVWAIKGRDYMLWSMKKIHGGSQW